MTAGNKNSAGVGGQGVALTATVEATAGPALPNPLLGSNTSQRIALRPAELLFSPQESLVWIIGLLGVGACIVPWFARGWLWFGLIATPVALLACYDAIALWLTREECAPVLLQPEKQNRGREGQTIRVSFALTGSGRRWLHNDIRVAMTGATQNSETAIRVKDDPQRLKHEQPDSAAGGSTPASATHIRLWPWTAEIALLRRGLWPGPRVGIQRQSHFRIWRLRRWFGVPALLRIEANLRPGQQEILSSPIFHILVASRQTPWTGHGRDFERLRESHPGDTYSEIAWKSTARRGGPVTRLFQWEQKSRKYLAWWTIAGIRACSPCGRGPRERRPTRTCTATDAGSRSGNGAGGSNCRAGTGRRIWSGRFSADGAKSWLRAAAAIPVSPIS